MIRKKDEYTLEKRAIANGIGDLEFHHKFTKEETFGKCRVFSEITLLPGQTVGEHPHEGEMEIYYMLEGELISCGANKPDVPFLPGDIMVTGGGDTHALRNESDAPGTILAVVIL